MSDKYVVRVTTCGVYVDAGGGVELHTFGDCCATLNRQLAEIERLRNHAAEKRQCPQCGELVDPCYQRRTRVAESRAE